MSIIASAPAVFIIAIAFLAGGTVKGAVGVGLPLVAVPIMAMVLKPTTAIALPIIPILISNVWQTWDCGYFLVSLKRFWPLFVALIPTTLIGGQLLVSVSAETSAMLLGSMLIIFCVLQLSPLSIHIPERAERWLSPLIGLASGFVGGMTSFFGPIPVTYLMLLRLPKDEFVGTIALFYLIACSMLYIMLAAHEILTLDELLVSALALLPVMVGLLLGRMLRRRISQETFRRALILVLCILGLSLLGRSL
jgi:uncharacterized membrane protein YfcA